MTIPLEDNFTDIVGKAQSGLGVADSELARRAGVDLARLKSFLDGNFDGEIAARIAPVLGLNADALIAIGEGWHPQPVSLPGLVGFNTPFGDIAVNSYLAWDAAAREAVAFDTGSDCSAMLEHLRSHQLTLKLIFLTHSHGDHIFEIDRLAGKTGAPAFISRREPLDGAEPFDEGCEFTAGSLRIGTRLTRGHSPGGITFVLNGLERPVAVVGDALFAGSMGGAHGFYKEALRTNLERIFSLPNETVLCPGHGPMTTIAEEKKHNAFFATAP